MTTYVVTLEGYVPAARFDRTPWTQAQISQAATQDGPFTVLDTVTLSPVDSDPTDPLSRDFTITNATLASGWYLVTFLDGSGNQGPTTPVLYPPGEPGTWTYSDDPSASDKDAVRFEIQDTNMASPLLRDAEINWAILSETGQTAGTPTTLTIGDIYRSSARCLESLSRLFAAQADTELGSLKTTYSKQATVYAQRAEEMRAKAQGMNAPYCGGLSQAEKRSFHDDADLTQPAFSRTEFDSPYTGSQAGFDNEDFGPPAA